MVRLPEDLCPSPEAQPLVPVCDGMTTARVTVSLDTLERMFVKCSEQRLTEKQRPTKVLAKEKHESSAFMSNRYVSFYKGGKCVEEVMRGEPFSKQVLSPLNSDPGRYQRGAGGQRSGGATTVTRAPGPDIPGGL
ncbi:hypothetical protein MDA_GLEAN10022034 [Myotis davidii]|uniref:Uncharacterized protein n=1 Tax=Myotis davidii TaxID=225400 RepID=L5MA01_MYODS|nr:hypothetical protein MDA_GLEAN10022034 [Myotis davidii]